MKKNNYINDQRIQGLLDECGIRVQKGFIKIIRCRTLLAYIASRAQNALEHFKYGSTRPNILIQAGQTWQDILKPGFNEKLIENIVDINQQMSGSSVEKDHALYEAICKVSFTRKFMLRLFLHYWAYEIEPTWKKMKDTLSRINLDSDLERSAFFSSYSNRFLVDAKTFKDMRSEDDYQSFCMDFWDDAVKHVYDGREVIDELIILNKPFIMSHILKFTNNTLLEPEELFNEVFIHLKFNFNHFEPHKCSLLGYWSVTIKRFLINLTSRKGSVPTSGDELVEPASEPEVVLEALLNLENKELINELFTHLDKNDAIALEKLFGLNGNEKHTIKAVAEFVGKKPNNFRRYDLPRIFNKARQSISCSKIHLEKET